MVKKTCPSPSHDTLKCIKQLDISSLVLKLSCELNRSGSRVFNFIHYLLSTKVFQRDCRYTLSAIPISLKFRLSLLYAFCRVY